MTAPEAYINTQQPVIADTAEPGSTITVWLDDDETTGGTAEVDSAGDWCFPLAVALSEGTHQAKATATDKAGNVSPASVARGLQHPARTAARLKWAAQ